MSGKTFGTARTFGACADITTDNLPSGGIGANSSQNTLAQIALDGSGIADATSYLWAVAVDEDGTYTSAATLSSTTAQSPTLTPDGPGTYVFTCVATNANGSSTFRRTVTVTRPEPVLTTDLSSGGVTGGATTSITLGDSASADGVTYSTTAYEYPGGMGIVVTDYDTAAPEFPNPAQDTDGKAVHVTSTATDAYGRTSTLSRTLIVEGTGGGADLTPPASPTPAKVTNATAAVTSKSLGSFSASGTLTGSGKYSTGSAAPAPSINGSGAGPYDWSASGLNPNSVALYRFELDDGAGQVAYVYDAVVTGAPSPIEWSTLAEVDLTTDLTDKTFTKGAGDETLYLNDGTTPKAIIRHFDRVATSTAVCRATASDGGLYLSGSLSGKETNVTILPPSGAFTPDYADRANVYRVDMIIGTTTHDTGHVLSAMFGPDNSSAAADGTVGFQIQRTGGSTFPLRLKRNLSGQAFSADYGTVPSAAITNLAVCAIIRLGRNIELYATEQATYLDADPSGATYVGEMGTVAQAINSETELFSAIANAQIGIYSSDSDTSTAIVEKVRWQLGTGI
jgi:hypothetical protein